MQSILRNTVLIGRGVVERGWDERVQTNSKGIFNHTWYYSIQDRAAHLKTGICVDLDQPGFKIFIDHEIKPKYLKIISFSFGIDKAEGRLYGICCNRFDVGIDILRKIVAVFVWLSWE